MDAPTDMHRTFVDLIESLAEADPRRGVVFVDIRRRESRTSYPELHRSIVSASRSMQAQGVQCGDRVLVALRNDLTSIVAFLGLIRMGAIPMSVQSPLLSQDRNAHRRRLGHLRATHRIPWVMESPDLADLTGPGFRRVSASSSTDSTGGALAAVAVESTDDVFVQFSSGSTDHPKGIRITHRNLLYNLDLIVRNDGRKPDDCQVGWLPLCHDMGLIGCLLSNLVTPNDTVILDPMCFLTRPAIWLHQASKHGGTTTAIPNFGLDVCTDRIKDDHLDGHAVDLSRFRYIYCGSEPVRPRSVRRFEQRFARWGLRAGSVFPVYGMAETTLIVTAPEPREPLVTERVDGVEVPSVGRPLGDFDVELRDGDRIWVRGTSVSPGYLGPGSPHGAGGWLDTGDLGRIDDRGRLFITGRSNDLILHQGRNFFGHDIAETLERSLDIRSGKVFALAVPSNGRERVVIVGASPRGHRPGSGPGLAPFADRIRRTVLEEYGLPVDDVLIVRQMPKTTSGKIDRRRCKELYVEALQGASESARIVAAEN